jgi:hypothetical protein
MSRGPRVPPLKPRDTKGTLREPKLKVKVKVTAKAKKSDGG